MKLNQCQKRAIVRAIFDDVPVADGKAIHEAVQKAIVKAMSPACQRAYKACPKALNVESTYDITYDRERHVFVVGDADFSEVVKPWIEAKNARKDIERRFEAAIDGCSTLKQLTEMLPEFAAYFPTETAPTKNLPVIANLVADIVKLGWKGAAS